MEPQAAPNHRMLLVDDQNDEWTEVLRRAVAAAGIADHDLVHAQSVSAGLETARSGGVDSIVLRLEPIDQKTFETSLVVASVVEDAAIVVATRACDRAVSDLVVRMGADDCIPLADTPEPVIERMLRHSIARSFARQRKANDAVASAGLLERGTGAPLRALLVDDSPNSRALVLAYLSHSAVEMVTAENGEDAIELFERGDFDVVLMDVHMPVLDGAEATEQIRRWESKEGRSPVPIIALCGQASVDDADHCVHAGYTDFLPKPFSRAELLETLARYTSVSLPLGADGGVALGESGS